MGSSLARQMYSNDISYNIEVIRDIANAVKFKNNRDFYLGRNMDEICKVAELIQLLYLNDLKYPWKEIEESIKESFNLDKEISGASINLDWKLGVPPNRMLLNVQFKNENNGE